MKQPEQHTFQHTKEANTAAARKGMPTHTVNSELRGDCSTLVTLIFLSDQDMAYSYHSVSNYAQHTASNSSHNQVTQSTHSSKRDQSFHVPATASWRTPVCLPRTQVWLKPTPNTYRISSLEKWEMRQYYLNARPFTSAKLNTLKNRLSLGFRLWASVTVMTETLCLKLSKIVNNELQNNFEWATKHEFFNLSPENIWRFIILHHQNTHQGEDKTVCQRTLPPLVTQRLTYMLNLWYLALKLRKLAVISLPIHLHNHGLIQW